MDMERRRSFSHTFTDRPSPLRIATVKPVSKSFSEDDLLKATEPEAINQSPTRVFSRFNVQDLSLLKKDNIIGNVQHFDLNYLNYGCNVYNQLWPAGDAWHV